MYGWRGRVGLIVPSSNTTMEEEFRGWIPYGVSLHTARISLKKVNLEELRAMKGEVERAASLLADAKVDVIVYGCTTGSLVGGKGYDEEIKDSIEKVTGIRAVVTATAVLEALRELKAKKISVITPYIDEVNKKEKEFLEVNGFEVIDIKGLQIEDNVEIGKLQPESVYRLAKSVNLDSADALFISCTNLRTFEVIDYLEVDLGIPVISSNSATLWSTLRALGIHESIIGLGTLLL